jgi:hypothetical protein
LFEVDSRSQGRSAVPEEFPIWGPSGMEDLPGGRYFGLDGSVSVGFGMEWVEGGSLGFSPSV